VFGSVEGRTILEITSVPKSIEVTIIFKTLKQVQGDVLSFLQA